MGDMNDKIQSYENIYYPYTVLRQENGSYFVSFPDLPGCVTQVESADEIAEMAEEVRLLWIETELSRGADIPNSSADFEYSGKFVARVPRSLHRELAQAAQKEGCSLNQYVVHLLSSREISDQLRRDLELIRTEIVVLRQRLPYHVAPVKPSRQLARTEPDFGVEQIPVAA